MNQRRLAKRSSRRSESARRKELVRQLELRRENPDWPADRVRAEARGSMWTEPPPEKRKRDRRNKYGRRGGRNRCGHDPKKFHRPKIARNLPPFVYWAISAFEQTVRQHRLPSQLNFRFSSRSEGHEAIGAITPVLLAWTMVMTTRIARPSKRRPGRVEGYTVDHHIAPLSGMGESRVERVIATYKDWGWHHFTVGKNGRRLAAQPIELTDDGYEGQAAIRKWTSKFWQDIGISLEALKSAQKHYATYLDQRTARQAAARKDQVAVTPLVEQLTVALGDPTSRPRPPP